jgi:hypothetical protein
MSGAGTEVSLDDTLYTINLDAGISSGAVTSAVPAAFEGNSVGVTVTPGDGKRLRPGSLKYNSEPIDEDETPYTFTMPPDPVTIYAEFADYGIRYVTRYGAGDWDGTSWENASNDLQKMMDELAAASLDDTAGYTGPYIVKLGAGPHRPKYEPMVPANPAVLDNYAYNDSREDFRDRAFILRPGVQVWGGYPEPGGNDDTRDPAANVSILSGDLDNSGSTPNMHDAYHVVLGVGTLAVPITDMTVLDGLTISGGNANGSGSLTVGTYSIERQNAGGIYNRNASPTLNRVMISGNTVEIDGGGMYNRDGSSPKLANVTISDNHITGGGGMYNYDSSPTLTDVTIGGDDPADKNAANCGGGVYNIDSSQMTMNGGFITGNTAYYGGGMYNGNGSSPVLTDVTISENEAAGGSNAAGGGMFNYDNSSPVLTNVIIDRNNSYDAGGGMFNYDNSSPVLANVTISNNNTSNAGGGRMYNGSSSPVLANVTISGNTATISKLGGGGGMYNANGSSPVLINVRISGNKVTSSVSDRIGGGGMYNYLNSSPVLINVTIAGNYADVVTGADRGGGGIYNSTSSSPKIKNSIIWGNTTSASSPGIFNFNNSTPAVTDSIVQDSGGSDPLFVTASIPAAPTAEGDYRLSATSPAVNMGSDSDYPANADDTSVFPASPGLSSEAKAAINAALLKDLAGNTPRIQGAAIDMGAYELQ